MSIAQARLSQTPSASVIALHCSLGSGRQWTKLRQHLGFRYHWCLPDLWGYGSNPDRINLPTTLAEEVASLESQIRSVEGPIHLIGHSYGGAVAFKMATASPYADRVRSLTLIEPVLPTLLLDTPPDKRLHDLFAKLARDVFRDIEEGAFLEAADRFIGFWNGSSPPETIPPEGKLRLIEQVERIIFDFAAVLAEQDVMAQARALRVPTLLASGGLSPYLTQRIVGRMASSILDAEAIHLPSAGHMLPLTHGEAIFPAIERHLARADYLCQDALTVAGASKLLPFESVD